MQIESEPFEFNEHDRSRGEQVQATKTSGQRVYLDYASHTPAHEDVLAEFCRVERECIGNAMSSHAVGRTARAEVERVTAGIATLVGVRPSEVIFTSGASEANNLAIKGIARAHVHKGRHILATCLEHPSVSATLSFLHEAGFEVELVRVMPSGEVDLGHLKSVLRADTILFCVSAVDSELGVVQPLEEIAETVRRAPNCLLHVDGAQAVGKLPEALKCKVADTFCFTPHKFYGLGGFGVLVKREGLVIEPMIHGGGLSVYRGGTPSPAMAAACFKAMQLAYENIGEWAHAASALRQYVIDSLKTCNQVRVNSPVNGSPYILNLSVQGIKGMEMQAELDSRGVAVSVKSACSVVGSPSRPVLAVSGDKKNALCSWRVSFSHLTTIRELDYFLKVLNEIIGAKQ